jgi:hypothetical protein
MSAGAAISIMPMMARRPIRFSAAPIEKKIER